MFNFFPQHHFGPLGIDRSEVIEFRKTLLKDMHRAESLARPESCFLCGEGHPKFCNSHSIPQFCLRNIARNGEVYTPSCLMGCELFTARKGIKSAGTFRMICRDCDSRFFSAYENEGPLATTTKLSNEQLGQIAVKVLLLDQFKELTQLKFFQLKQADYPLIDLEGPILTPRSLDLSDDGEAIEHACSCIDGEDNYVVLLDELLNYTTPLAFQGRIAPASGFDTTIINRLWDMDKSNKLAGFYLCLFPMTNSTRIVLFCDPYSHQKLAVFINDLTALPSEARRDVLVKLMFAYSEEVYISPFLPKEIFSHHGLSQLARMSGMRAAPPTDATRPIVSRMLDIQHAREFAISNLPDVPHLLGTALSMQALKTNA